MSNKNQLEQILLPIKNELENFEKKLDNLISCQDNFLNEDIRKFIFNNPKRLRPIFVYLFSKIFEIEHSKTVDDIALATEIIHSASLIHDDILDEEETRRGYPTFFSKFGSKIAVLEGDFLLSVALEVLSNTSTQITNIFSDKIKKTILGELEQNLNINKITDIDTYLKKTIAKTGNLFFAGLESLFTLKNIESLQKENSLNFIHNYTLAFQIKNDVENIIQKNSTDIKNGNYTLPVIYFCMENSIDSLQKTKKEDFEKYIKLSLDKVKEYKKEALKFLQIFEETPYKKMLFEVCKVTLDS